MSIVSTVGSITSGVMPKAAKPSTLSRPGFLLIFSDVSLYVVRLLKPLIRDSFAFSSINKVSSTIRRLLKPLIDPLTISGTVSNPASLLQPPFSCIHRSSVTFTRSGKPEMSARCVFFCTTNQCTFSSDAKPPMLTRLLFFWKYMLSPFVVCRHGKSFSVMAKTAPSGASFIFQYQPMVEL